MTDTRYGTLTFDALREANVRRCETHYHPVADWSLTDWMTAVAGEAGELAGVIKNVRRAETERNRNGHAIPEHALAALGDEAADVVIYLDLLCERAGVNLSDAVARKFNRVSRERLRTDIALPVRARCICGPSEPSYDTVTGRPWPHCPSCPMAPKEPPR